MKRECLYSNKYFTKNIIIIIFISVVAITLFSCKSRPKSIFGKAHIVLKEFAEKIKHIQNKEDINNNYQRLNELLIKFNRHITKLGEMKLNDIQKLSEKYKNESKTFLNFLKKILNDKSKNGFINKIKFIGKLSLKGQKIRNTFFEIIYQLRRKISEQNQN